MLNDFGEILAYFSLTFKEFNLTHHEISKTEVKRLDGISKNANNIRAYLIGQIGKNQSIQNNHLKLKDILQEIFIIINQAKTLVGGRLIVLECENHPKLLTLYQNHDFKHLKRHQNTDDNLELLYLFIN